MAAASAARLLTFKLPHSQHGDGPVLFKWRPDGSLLATAGTNGVVHIVDRSGESVDTIQPHRSGGSRIGRSRQRVLALEWSCDGAMLAVLPADCEQVLLWHAARCSSLGGSCDEAAAGASGEGVCTYVGTLPQPTVLAWARVPADKCLLAVGNAKGRVMLYRADTRSESLVTATAAINCCTWTTGGQLAVGSADGTALLLLDASGRGLRHDTLPCAMQSIACTRSLEAKSEADDVLAAHMADNTLMIAFLDDPDEDPVQFAFLPAHGALIAYNWTREGHLIAGFSRGVVVISPMAFKGTVQEEVFRGRFHTDDMVGMAYCAATQRVATIARDVVKVADLSNLREVRSQEAKLTSSASGVTWSPDGQLLTVSTVKGDIFCFALYAVDDPRRKAEVLEVENKRLREALQAAQAENVELKRQLQLAQQEQHHEPPPDS